MKYLLYAISTSEFGKNLVFLSLEEIQAMDERMTRKHVQTVANFSSQLAYRIEEAATTEDHAGTFYPELFGKGNKAVQVHDGPHRLSGFILLQQIAHKFKHDPQGTALHHKDGRAQTTNVP